MQRASGQDRSCGRAVSLAAARAALERAVHPTLLAYAPCMPRRASPHSTPPHPMPPHTICQHPTPAGSPYSRTTDHPIHYPHHLTHKAIPPSYAAAFPPLQLARLVGRDGSDEDRARARIAAQMPLAAKRRLADQELANEGSVEELEEKVGTEERSNYVRGKGEEVRWDGMGFGAAAGAWGCMGVYGASWGCMEGGWRTRLLDDGTGTSSGRICRAAPR